jgi:hypothetical protein
VAPTRRPAKWPLDPTHSVSRHGFELPRPHRARSVDGLVAALDAAVIRLGSMAESKGCHSAPGDSTVHSHSDIDWPDPGEDSQSKFTHEFGMAGALAPWLDDPWWGWWRWWGCSGCNSKHVTGDTGERTFPQKTVFTCALKDPNHPHHPHHGSLPPRVSYAWLVCQAIMPPCPGVAVNFSPATGRPFDFRSQ